MAGSSCNPPRQFRCAIFPKTPSRAGSLATKLKWPSSPRPVSARKSEALSRHERAPGGGRFSKRGIALCRGASRDTGLVAADGILLHRGSDAERTRLAPKRQLPSAGQFSQSFISCRLNSPSTKRSFSQKPKIVPCYCRLWEPKPIACSPSMKLISRKQSAHTFMVWKSVHRARLDRAA